MKTPDASPAEQTLPTRRRRAFWRHLILSIVILVCGMMIGSALTARVLWTRVTDMIQHPEHVPDRIAYHIKIFLGLNDEQVKEVKEVIVVHQRRVNGLRRVLYPQMQTELDTLRDDIAAALTPEQAQRWTKHFERLRARWWPPLLPEESLAPVPAQPQAP